MQFIKSSPDFSVIEDYLVTLLDNEKHKSLANRHLNEDYMVFYEILIVKVKEKISNQIVTCLYKLHH